MTVFISSTAVRNYLLTRREIALLDVREEATFALGHPLFAANVPLSRLELEVLDRIPRQSAKVVVYDDGEGFAQLAFARLMSLGYTDVNILEDGLHGWRSAGFELFRDVNSASKAFGELVEVSRDTPSLAAPDVLALIENDPNVVVLDVRRFDEYQTMSVPKAVSVPGAELVLRARALAPDPATTIVIHCAGRTRSIIGTQSLINARLPNRIVALRNGTMGWTLAGQVLDHGASRRFCEPTQIAEREARAAALNVAYRAGVRQITDAILADLAADASRTLYRFDVRTPEEYEAGHRAEFRSAPGGQLVQEIDAYAPVRGARIVLADERGVRANMTASWLAQMGYDVYVLENSFSADTVTGSWLPRTPVPPPVFLLSADELAQFQKESAVVVVDFSTSADYARGHIPGAWFVIRSRLEDAVRNLPNSPRFVLTSRDGILARFAAPEFRAAIGSSVHVLAGGTAAWIEKGYALETGLSRIANEINDVYRRPYEGTDSTSEAMQAYLDWEFGLVDQLTRDATHGFYVI